MVNGGSHENNSVGVDPALVDIAFKEFSAGFDGFGKMGIVWPYDKCGIDGVQPVEAPSYPQYPLVMFSLSNGPVCRTYFCDMFNVSGDKWHKIQNDPFRQRRVEQIEQTFHES